jgi:hypothetical protein
MSSQNSFEMFKSPNDYANWDKYDQQVDNIDLPKRDRQRVRIALGYFRSLMGEDFLGNIVNTGHPFWTILTNVAPRERVVLAELAEQVQGFAGVEKFDSLSARIASCNPDEFAEGISVLAVAHKLKCSGFSVSFEPKVSVTQRTGVVASKLPDIKITNESNSERADKPTKRYSIFGTISRGNFEWNRIRMIL